MPPSSEPADHPSLLRRAHELAAERGSQQVTVEHLALTLLEREPGVRRHWRSLGINDDLAVRELGVTGAPAAGHPGRNHRFLSAVTGQLVITPEATELLRAYSELKQSIGQGDSASAVAATLLTFLSPLPGSPMRPEVASPVSKSAPAETAESVDLLAEHALDLTRLALFGALDPMIGRERELDELIRVLSRRRKRNPLLVGEPGVGKTALVEGLAMRIAQGDVGKQLVDARIISVSLASLLGNTRYRGEFEARVHDLLSEVTDSDRRTILFIDEFHLIVKAGAAEGGLDLGSLLLAGMARDELSVIGATTPALYHEHVRPTGPLARRVQVIEVGEPSRAETVQILRGVRSQYETFHGVQITDHALQAAARLSARTHRRRPDAALDLIDDACAAAQLAVADRSAPVTVSAAQVTEALRRRGNRRWPVRPRRAR
jgi:ATP-dependent Clp protease ATP-binding subunit ClpA